MASDETVVEFPLLKEELTLEEAIEVIRRRNPESGIIAWENECGHVNHIQFGDITNKDALWIAENLKRHVFQEDEIHQDEI